MENEMPKAAPDLLDMLLQVIADRVKKAILSDLAEQVRYEVKEQVRIISADDISDLEEYIDQRVTHSFERGDMRIDADSVEGLDRYFEGSIEEVQRNGEIKIDADSVEGLEEFIKDTVKNATVSIDF